MSQRRFLVSPADLDQDLVELSPEEAAHALKVLRLAPGDDLWLLDGAGRRARARVETTGKGRVSCRVLEREAPPRPRPRLVLLCGLLKAPALELLAVKLTELAVDEVRLVLSQRAVPKPKPGREARLDRLAAQALKQCGAAWAPVFHPPQTLAEALAAAPDQARKVILYEDETGQSLAEALARPPAAEEVWGLVGPEGGFAPEEVAQAQAAGFVSCGLGPVILRAETAALACAALVRFYPVPGLP